VLTQKATVSLPLGGRGVTFDYSPGTESETSLAAVSVMWTAASAGPTWAVGVYRLSVDGGPGPDRTWGAWRPLSLSVPDLDRPLYASDGSKSGFERTAVSELVASGTTLHDPRTNETPNLALTKNMVALHDFWAERQLSLLMSTSSLLPILREGVVRVMVVITKQLGGARLAMPGVGAAVGPLPRDLLLSEDAVRAALFYMELALNIWISKLTGYHGFDRKSGDVRVELFGLAVDKSHQAFCEAHGLFKGDIKAEYIVTDEFVPTLDSRTAPCGMSWDDAACNDTICHVLSRPSRGSPTAVVPAPTCAFGTGRYDMCLTIRDLPDLDTEYDFVATGAPTVIHYDSYNLAYAVKDFILATALYGSVSPADREASKLLLYTNCKVLMHELGHTLMLDDVYVYRFVQGGDAKESTIMWTLDDGLTDLDHQYVRTLWDLQAPAL
jgi:hypothetical protein